MEELQRSGDVSCAIMDEAEGEHLDSCALSGGISQSPYDVTVDSQRIPEITASQSFPLLVMGFTYKQLHT